MVVELHDACEGDYGGSPLGVRDFVWGELKPENVRMRSETEWKRRE